MHDERTQYVEFSRWPGLAWAVLWGAVVLSCYPILAGWDHDIQGSARWLLVGGVVVLVCGLTAVVGGLTVRVEETRIVLHLGRVRIIRTVVPFHEILSTRSVQYRPLAEFGGWGVRGFGKRRAWTARGDRAVALDLTEERELLIGSDHPQRLEERIRTFAGDQMGGSPRS